METIEGPMDLELKTRVSVRGIIAGVLVALAFELMLMVLGTAIGTTVFPRRTEVGKGAAIGLASWFMLALLISAFAGGWVAAGGARALRARDGVLQGMVTWAVVSLIGVSLVGGAVRGAVAGIFGLGADQAAARVAMGNWGLFAALLLPLLAAMLGGVAGAIRERRVIGLPPQREMRHRKPIVTGPHHTGDRPPPRVGVPPTPVPIP
jgi:hypothetical protein